MIHKIHFVNNIDFCMTEPGYTYLYSTTTMLTEKSMTCIYANTVAHYVQTWYTTVCNIRLCTFNVLSLCVMCTGLLCKIQIMFNNFIYHYCGHNFVKKIK